MMAFPVATDFTGAVIYNLSMEIIYVDSLFLLNFIIDYLLLVLTFRLCGLVIRRVRCVLGALLGGAWAVLCFLPGLEFLAAPACKAALWGWISLAAFGGEAHLLKCALSFLTISAVFGGGVWAASMLAGGSNSIAGAVQLSFPMLVFSFAVCYVFLSLTWSQRLRGQAGKIAAVRLVLRDRSVELNALRDTGNTLREQLSGRKVMAVGIGDVASLFTPEEAEALRENDGAQALLRLNGLAGELHFRPVVYSALGVSGALIPAFIPEQLWIDGRQSGDYVVAVSPVPVGNAQFHAVI